MKRKLLVAMLVSLLALWLCGLALAETDPIICTMEVSPSTLSEPGDVSVTITVSNSGETDLTDPLTLYSPTSEIVKDFGDNGSVTLKAGEVKTWTGTWNVNQRTLDNGQIVFFVKYVLYKDDGSRDAKSQPIRGKLNATESKTDVEIRRTISPGTARDGQTVTVKYDIVNTGTVSLKNITLEESKDISKKVVKVADELKAGETAQVKLPVTMGKKDLTSSAVITFTTGTSTEKQTRKVEEQKITYGEAAMTAKLTSSAKGVAVNGTVTLTLELKNSGSVNYTDVRVTDATLGDVFTNQQLGAGETLKLEKEITLTKTTDYQFKITAIDNTGTEVTLDTDALTLTAVDPSKMVHLNVTLASDRTEVYTQPGIVRFTITVENDSEIEAKDVAIYHGTTKISTIPLIPAGETRKLTRDAALSMAGRYQFTAVSVDALGVSNTFISNEIQIAFSVPTPAPLTPTPPAVPTPEPTYNEIPAPRIGDPSVGTIPKAIRAVFYPLMIISALLLAAGVVLLILATRKRVEQKKASEAALDHLDRAKRRDYVTPGDEPEPVEAAPPRHEGKAPSVAATEEGSRNSSAAPDADAELPHMKYVRNAYQRTGKEQTDAYGKKSLFDEDPLTGSRGSAAESAGSDDLYHTYGGDNDIHYQHTTAKTSETDTAGRSKAKDWSAYARKPLAEPPAEPAPDEAYDRAAGYTADDAAYPAEAGYEGAYDPYAAYDDVSAMPAATAYSDPDGYAQDPFGYEGQTGDGQPSYDAEGYAADQTGYDPTASYGDTAGYGYGYESASDAGFANGAAYDGDRTSAGEEPARQEPAHRRRRGSDSGDTAR